LNTGSLHANSRATVWVLFAAGLLGYGYFHPGGGWNQNARFALVRAIVEDHRFTIDSFLVYARGDDALVRLPVHDATVERGGVTEVLTWAGTDKRQVPISPRAPAEAPRVVADNVAATGDLAFYDGHFHPNKAPGTSFAAVPAYALLNIVERAAGARIDSWRVLTLNAWLTSFLSVGLLSAAGLVVFYRVARRMSGSPRAVMLATLGFGFGTLYWPYATGLREHNIIAVALLFAYGCLMTMKESEVPAGRRLLLAGLAGLAGGWAVITNYTVIVAVALLAAYLLLVCWRRKPWPALVAFSVGAALPLALLAAYNLACFGRILTTNYAYENILFLSTRPALLGVLDWPRLDVAVMLTVTPFRGVFVSSPVLVLGVLGLRRLFREKEWRLDGLLFLALLAFFFVFNCSFNGWHGGWATGPRYLLPAFPFLALPMVRVLERPRPWAIAVIAVSCALNLLAITVDPEAPVGTAGHAIKPGVPAWMHSPLLDYQWPLFTEGYARPVVEAQRDGIVERVRMQWAKEGRTPDAIQQGALAVRQEIDGSIARGENDPLQLAAVRGFVSANPMGVYEDWYFRNFPQGSPEAEGNAFNVGEWLWPGSRASVLPLLVVLGLCGRRLLAGTAPPPIVTPVPEKKRKRRRE
jgi:hypothetical protein